MLVTIVTVLKKTNNFTFSKLDLPKMFTNESTENLLENFETELELIEEVVVVKNNVNVESQAPVPSKRAFQQSQEIRPMPATRHKVQSLNSIEKDDKNDENEIIQLSSISSDLMKSSRSSSQASPVAIKNISQDSSRKQTTVIVVNEKKKASNRINVQVFHESQQALEPEESAFFVVSHGKWAKNNVKAAEEVKDDDTESELPLPTKTVLKTPTPVIPEVHFISEKKKIKKLVKKVAPPSSASTASSKTSHDSSSEAYNSEDTPQIKKKSKSKMRKKEKTKKRKAKRKLSSEDAEEGSVTSRTEESVSETKLKDPVVNDDNRSIGK